MIRLSNSELLLAHRFLLQAHAAGDTDTLRRVIPQGIERVIGGDRASFNQIETGADRNRVVPTPVPAWWPRFGEVYHQHLRDHPLWDPQVVPRLNRVISLDDPRHARRWQRSLLFQEYFLPLGMKHQLSSLIARSGPHSIGIAINRSRRGFERGDRQILGLLAPHLSQAWGNAAVLEKLRREAQPPFPPAAAPGQAIITVDPARGTMRALSPGAAAMLQAYFGRDSEGGGRLPDALRRWLGARQEHLASPAGIEASSLVPLVMRGTAGVLTVRLVQRGTDESLILLETQPASGRVRPVELTRREREIVQWLREGKRNVEIAMILGISPRTVGKHLENLFVKLGVETRTAAVRVAFESREGALQPGEPD